MFGIELTVDNRSKASSEDSPLLSPLNMNQIQQISKPKTPQSNTESGKSINTDSSPIGSSKDGKQIAEDSPQMIYLKKFIERFSQAGELLKHSPEEQKMIEEKFRLNRNTSNSPASIIRKPKRRETTYSGQSQKIIEEKLEEYRNPKPIESICSQIKEFWKQGNEEVPLEDRQKLLFQNDLIQGFKINPETPILEHVKTNNKILQRNLGITDDVKLDTEEISPQSQGDHRITWLQLKKRVNSLRRGVYLSPKEPSYDAVERSERDNRELAESEHSSPKKVKTRRMNSKTSRDSSDKEVDGESERSKNQKCSIFRKLAAPRTTILPKINLSEKTKDSLQKLLGDNKCRLGDESSVKDLNSTTNTISSQLDSPLQSPLLVKECLTPQHKKSRFNLSRASSLRSEAFLHMLEHDLGVETVAALPKRTPKTTKTNVFSWKIEDGGVEGFTKVAEKDESKTGSSFRSSRQITLPPLNQGDLSFTKTRELSKGSN
mgnify:FL=1